MANVFSRSWGLTKSTFSIMNKDKEIILYPIFAMVLSFIFIIAMFIPTIISVFVYGSDSVTFSTLQWILLFLTYLGLAVIATFFSVCVVYTAKKRFEGRDAQFLESIGFAFSKLHLIFLWGIVSATVGLIFRILEQAAEKAKGAGKIALSILNSVLGLMWAIATIFVVQGIVYEGLGPFKAIKKSVFVLKKTWGESLVRYFGFGLAEFIIILIGLFIIIPLTIILAMISPVLLLLGILIGIIFVVGVILIFNTATAVFNTALYIYATEGKLAAGFKEDMIKHAFNPKPARRFM